MTDKIKIAVRVRPFNQREQGEENIITMEDNVCLIKDPSTGEDRQFTFDRCIWSHDSDGRTLETNEYVFETLGKELLDNTYAGYNSTIFAYGQTGSGKSYSIEGYPPDSGLLQRICEAIFARKQEVEEQDENNSITVNVSYLEIYNEKLRDLLDPSEKTLKIYSTNKTGVTIKNLSTAYSESYQDILNLLEDGKKLRIVASTNMNKTSSRSHAVFTIYYQEKQINDGKKQVVRSKINIVDLAGSERQSSTGATGQRLKEGSNINKSLTYLGTVIQKLGENCNGAKNFIPYRNSQLTHILSESLGGNSKTIMIAALSPAAINYDETLSTLRFAQNVSAISTKTTANVDEEAASLQKMKDEILELKKRIEAVKSGMGTAGEADSDDDEGGNELEELKEIMRNQLSKLSEINKSSDDLKHQREEIDKKREEALKNAGLTSSVLGKAIDTNNDMINLINIADDPSISNCLVYLMQKGDNSMGTSKDNKIMLKGLGIGEEHAILTNVGDDKLFVKPLDPENNKIVVNGRQITEKTELKHLDRLIFGHGNSFKVIIPAHKEEVKEQEVNDYSQILQDRLLNDTIEAQNMRKYLEEMRERLGEKKGMQFVLAFQQALDELDEANEYSRTRYLAFPLDKNNVNFAVEIMIDIKEYETDDPEIAIRCRHKRTNEIIFLWSYEKFKSRLELMAEWYNDLKDDGVLDKEYNIDPWIDISDNDIKQKVDEQKDVTEDKIKKLKAKFAEETKKLDQIKENKMKLLESLESQMTVEEKKQLDIYIE